MLDFLVKSLLMTTTSTTSLVSYQLTRHNNNSASRLNQSIRSSKFTNQHQIKQPNCKDLNYSSRSEAKIEGSSTVAMERCRRRRHKVTSCGHDMHTQCRICYLTLAAILAATLFSSNILIKLVQCSEGNNNNNNLSVLKSGGSSSVASNLFQQQRFAPLDVASSTLLSQFRAAAGQFRDRWVQLPSETSLSSGHSQLPAANRRRPLYNLGTDASRWTSAALSSSGPGGGATRRNRVMRALNRLWARMGPRNSIRVHNAFRDFAWRVLSGFSMPTPVIYELRRQHFYPPDEDLAQDKLFNRNTTKTIRTRRRRRLIDGADDNQASSTAATSERRQANSSGDDDEDSEPESFRDRLRMRLEDLLKLSRRSLFGQVVRLPSLFPFKRQEAGDDDDGGEDESGNQSTKDKNNNNKRRPRAHLVRQRLARQRRKKEAERQMISINGKQYYVNDDGELKELRPKGKAAR